MSKVVDSYRYQDGITKRMIKSWINLERPRNIPWTPLEKKISDCNVALISTAGIALKSDQPFDQEGESQNPWWGDPSFRVLPSNATEKEVRIFHLHIDPSFGEKDLNCIFPLQRLKELEESGEIGRSAAHHYSIMGYNLQPQVLLDETTPAIIDHLNEDQVDVVILIPV
jgi:D-proline reductase (dithiol) PrdB